MDVSKAAGYWEGNADAWTRHARDGYDIYRDALNTPAFLEMPPGIAGLNGIDIGCGEGSNTRHLARLGARMRGVDIAPTFIRHALAAERETPLGIGFETGDGMSLPFEDATFDFATAFMSLMDMPRQDIALREACRVIRPGGFLQFSILHPCFVPPHRKVLRDANGQTLAVELADYFAPADGRIDTWWFSTLPPAEREKEKPFSIPRFHRTMSEWVSMIGDAGFAIERFAEPSASAELAAAVPVVADTRVVPISLIVRVRKPA